MAQQSMTPTSTGRSVLRARRPEDADPLLAFRRDMGRLFDEFFSGFGVPSLFTGAGAGGAVAPMMMTPRVDVSENDQEIRMAVELPGVDEANLDVTIDDDTLTIRGEQQAESENEDRNYRLRERVRGSFMRALQLPFSPDPNQVRAVIRNGILNITIPKPQEVQQRTQRIQVQRDEGTGTQAAGAQTRTKAERATAGDKPAAGAASAEAASTSAADQSAAAAASPTSSERPSGSR